MNDIAFEDLKNEFFARKPREVDGVQNTSVLYYYNRLYQKILSRFKFSGIPETWDVNFCRDALFGLGYFTVCDSPAGILPFRCGLSGINVFNKPTTAIIANPILGNFQKTIGEDCEIVSIQWNYRGVWQLVKRYAVLLAMCDSGISVNLMNSKLAYVFGAENKSQSETFKKLLDDISCGKPAVFTNTGITGQMQANMFSMPVKQNFVADDIQLLKRKIINDFLTDIGINNANIEKRERMITSEAEANDEEIAANIQHWVDCIAEGTKKVNQMFDLNITIAPQEYGISEGETNEENNSKFSFLRRKEA